MRHHSRVRFTGAEHNPANDSTHAWIRIAAADECPPGAGRFVLVDGRELAVFHLTDPDRFVVTRNSCPHAGGNLAAGRVESGTVTCPWHQWTFDLDSGSCTTAAHVRLQRFECRLVGGVVFARLPLT